MGANYPQMLKPSSQDVLIVSTEEDIFPLSLHPSGQKRKAVGQIREIGYIWHPSVLSLLAEEASLCSIPEVQRCFLGLGSGLTLG